METKLYTITELSKILDLHPKTILRFIKEGKIKGNKVGRSWRVTEAELQRYCHGELSDFKVVEEKVNFETLEDRITISTVIEITEENSSEAARISNSLLAMLQGKDRDEKGRFDFFYYPEIEKAKYVFYGSPGFIKRIIETFEALMKVKGE